MSNRSKMFQESFLDQVEALARKMARELVEARGYHWNKIGETAQDEHIERCLIEMAMAMSLWAKTRIPEFKQ